VPKDIVISPGAANNHAAAALQGYTILSLFTISDLRMERRESTTLSILSGPAPCLTDDGKKTNLGGESCMCSEYVDPESVDPAFGLATPHRERFWSPRMFPIPVRCICA